MTGAGIARTCNRAGLVVALAAWLLGCAGADGQRLPFYRAPDLALAERETQAHAIGDFSLLDAGGARLSRRDLDGRITVMSFLYTRCAGICPRMVVNLRQVAAAVAGDPGVLLLSLSANPASDTPAELQRYARDSGIDGRGWRLLTGEPRAILALARHGLLAEIEPDGSFIHTETLWLVDARRRIRGLYNATSAIDTARLLEDIRRLETRG